MARDQGTKVFTQGKRGAVPETITKWRVISGTTPGISLGITMGKLFEG